MGVRGITNGKIWIFYIRNHAFLCIFALVNIAILMYRNMRQSGKILVGTFAMLSPTKLLGTCPPPPPVSAPMVISQKESNIASPNLVDMMMLRHPGMDQKSDWHGSDFWSKRREIKVASVFKCLNHMLLTMTHDS